VQASINIHTYHELEQFTAAFAGGHINMLVIHSRGGLGKSEAVRAAMQDHKVVWIGGHATPLKLYELLYQGRDQPVVFEEIDGLLVNPLHVGLLKQLCETRTPKHIAWASTDLRAFEIDGGRGMFETRSKVLMLCNSFDRLNDNVGALQTRATIVRFVPTVEEIIARIKAFATDDEVVAFLDAHADCLPDLNLRTYGKLAELKRAGLDWQRYARDEGEVHPKVREIAELLDHFEDDVSRIAHYSGSRRDYYNWKPLAVAYAQRQLRLTVVVDLAQDGEDRRPA
jgi:hypothetical protein